MSCGVVTITAPVTGTFCDERELDVAGAGRHVDDQVVDLAPVGVLEQLLERLRHHRPRHTIGVSMSIRKPIDIAWHAVGLERLERLAVVRRRPPRDAEHHRAATGRRCRRRARRRARPRRPGRARGLPAVVDLPDASP
jgi:hypothetical protein